MGPKYQALKGMEDLLPGEIEKWQWLEARARIFFEANGFKEIRTPLLEYTELFTRTVGEASDIVHKEMFSFEDRGGRNISLRPEMTASVARAVIEHGLLKTNKSLRLYYLGPMFRAERPQAGRKRQFQQIGIEIINEAEITSDSEAISLLCSFLNYAGLTNFKLWLNDLGKREDIQRTFRQLLRDYFTKEKAKLCTDCRFRLEKNVLRIFDCKVESCQPIIQRAPEVGPLSTDFVSLLDDLSKKLKVIPERKPRLVRGLDYYNGAVFEVTAPGLGAQDALAGGGRYDRLYSDLGSSPTPCTGFSIGMERLLVALEKAEPPLSDKIKSRKVYLALLERDDAAKGQLSEYALLLRERNIGVETFSGEFSLSNHLKKANQLGVRFVLILGSSELAKGCWTVKDMEKKTQSEVETEKLIPYLEEAFQS